MACCTRRGGSTIFWGVATGAAASILLLAGGLEALQQASIIAAAPFLLVMIGLCVGLYKALDCDPLVQRAPVTEAVVTQRPVTNGAGQDVAAELTPS